MVSTRRSGSLSGNSRRSSSSDEKPPSPKRQKVRESIASLSFFFFLSCCCCWLNLGFFKAFDFLVYFIFSIVSCGGIFVEFQVEHGGGGGGGASAEKSTLAVENTKELCSPSAAAAADPVELPVTGDAGDLAATEKEEEEEGTEVEAAAVPLSTPNAEGNDSFFISSLISLHVSNWFLV